ncbi:MAG: anthranilate synthase component I [Candidatus Omnitrophica bacterium]|nr:anthranilate synthase component I [Candidatus Omnitrophota bacterium]
MIYPSEKEFLQLTKKGNLIPVYKEILGDLETPVSAYFKIAKDAKYSFLLESIEGEEKFARFSFLAKDPELIFQSKGKEVTITRIEKDTAQTETHPIKDTPLSFLRNIMKQYKFVAVGGLPIFCGGLVGYMSYDTVRFFERLPEPKRDDLNLPDILLVLAKDLIIFDHLNHKIKIISCAYIDQKASNKEKLAAYNQALKKIERLTEELRQPLDIPSTRSGKPASVNALKVTSNFTKKQFEAAVRKAQKEIRAGEIIQVVPSQRFMVDLKTNPFNIYRTLRALNPSPYMYYLHFDGIDIAGASPEVFVRCENGIVETRPIAGTRPRGKDEKEDVRLAKELLADPKEKAEHIMLVDLGRNDLGRICKKGSVHLSEFMVIEKYSHVMHIISNVKGILRDDKDIFDILPATFPAGTVSGAPKIRAMEIINELENVKRGPYAGCVGYFSFSGNLDTCITIRTIVAKDKKAYVQAGGGIVADSKPANEYQETVNKAKAQITAIQMAHQSTF